MKILLFAHVCPSGGTGTYFKNLTAFFNKQRYNYTIFMHQREIDDPVVKPFLQDKNIFPYIKHAKLEYFVFRIFRKLKLEDFYAYFRDKLLINKIIKKNNPDLVFVSQGGGYEFFPFLKNKTPVLFIIHSLTTKMTPLRQSFFSKKYSKIPYPQNKCIINVSQAADKQFIQNTTIKNIKSIVVPSFGRNLGLPAKKHTGINILTAGHLQTWKNPYLWAETAIKLAKKYENVTFYWAGLGEMFDEIKEKVSICKNIKLLGFITNLEDFYRITDIYFQPSILESQGLAVVDALGAGIPCVVSDAGGLPDSIAEGKEGFVCPLDKPELFAERLEQLITNKSLRTKMAKNARNKYEQKFSQSHWEKSMASLIAEYAEL